MKNALENRRSHLYQDRETQTDGPKDLRQTQKQNQPLRRLHGAQRVGTHGTGAETK